MSRDAVASEQRVDDLVNIASHLPAMAARQPYQLAVVFPQGRDRVGRVAYTHYTFKQLNEESDRLARGLEKVGAGRGVRTVLMVTPSLEFFALVFALFKVGAVPVLIDPGMGTRNLGKCLAEAEPEAFIGIPKAHAARLLLGWARRSIRINIAVGGPRFGAIALETVRRLGRSEDPYPVAPTKGDDLAAILFTSGSTGVPKGAVYTHAIFTAQVESIKRLYGIEPGEIDLPTFPLFALFGPALGMTSIIPDMDATRPARVDPKKILEAIENFGVTNMFGSPALINRVGRFGDEQSISLPTLRRVISAGAPVPAAVIDRFAEFLAPGVQVFTPYGATEALPVASIGSDEILGETQMETVKGAGVCVGRPAPGMTVRVIRISDEPIPMWSDDLLMPTGEIGEIAVAGPVVTREYFHRPESTALAKIKGPAGEVIHRMGDLGYFDARGRLWFCGRKAHRVVTDDGVLFTIPCEGIFNRHPFVFRSALVGARVNGCIKPVVCIELEPEDARFVDRKKLMEELRSLALTQPHTKTIDTFLIHPSFPVDIRHNAKIFREKLAEWATRKLS